MKLRSDRTLMIEVFKTNVMQAQQAKKIIDLLLCYFPDCKINFDLEDCDKILRVEGCNFFSVDIINFLKSIGFICVKLK